MEEIHTVIGLRHDKSDETKFIFSSMTMEEFHDNWVESKEEPEFLGVSVAVDGYENLYTPQKVYGSDSYLIEKKPAAFRAFIFPVADLVMVQEVHYKFKDGD